MFIHLRPLRLLVVPLVSMELVILLATITVIPPNEGSGPKKNRVTWLGNTTKL